MIEFRLFILDFLVKWSLNIQIMSYLFCAFTCHFQKILYYCSSFCRDLISTKSSPTFTSYKSFANGFGSRMCINICNTIIKFFGIVNWKYDYFRSFSFLSINSVHPIGLSTFSSWIIIDGFIFLIFRGMRYIICRSYLQNDNVLFSANLNYYNIANFHFNCQLWIN